jgi:hypothetical protein
VVVNRLNELNGISGTSLITELAMLNALAEASILKGRSRYDIIPEEARKQLDNIAGRVELW